MIECHQKILDLRLGSIVHLDTWHYVITKCIGTWHYSPTSMHVAHANHKHALIFLKSIINEHKIYRSYEFNVTHLVAISTLGSFEIWLDCACDLN